MSTRTCTQCGAEKALAEFPKDPRGRGGRRANCKACQRIRAREQYEAHREKRLAYRRVHYAANREKLIKEMRAYDAANHEAKLARLKAYREAHREESVERAKAWRLANPERCRAHGQIKRARKKRVPYEKVDPAVVYRRDEGRCGICGEMTDPNDWHLDHIIPLSRGGHHLYLNVQVSHPVCNIAKGARMPGEEIQVAA